MHRVACSDATELLPLERIDARLQRYRLQMAAAERLMVQSLERYGQLSPIVVCLQEGSHVLIDGFKRLRAARKLKGMTALWAYRLEVDEQGSKAAIYNLNRVAQRPQEMEEAWIVYALVREDGMSQVEAGQLLGRHKSWINRRLAMIEKLCTAAKEELHLGLLSPSLARQLTRLPTGNQEAALATAREASLNSAELSAVVDLLLSSSTQEQCQFVLHDPRKAIRQSQGSYVHFWDPRLSTQGNRVAKQLCGLLDGLAKIDSWLRYRGRGELMACDRQPLSEGFERLLRETRGVAEATEDFLKELELP